MLGSPAGQVSKQELFQIALVSLFGGLAFAIARFVELGNANDWGDSRPLWEIAAQALTWTATVVVPAALAWVLKKFATDTRPTVEETAKYPSYRGPRKN